MIGFLKSRMQCYFEQLRINLTGKECVQFDLPFHFSLPCLHCLEPSGHNVPLWTVFRINAVATTIIPLSILTDLILWTYWLKWEIYWQVRFLLQGWPDTLWISWNKSWGNYCIYLLKNFGWDSAWVHCKKLIRTLLHLLWFKFGTDINFMKIRCAQLVK